MTARRRTTSLAAAVTVVVAGVLLTMSQAYLAVAAELPRGLPGARVAPDPMGAVVAAAAPVAFLDLSPGKRAYWKVDVGLRDADAGSFSLRVNGAGALVTHSRYGLTLAINSCDRPYIGGNASTAPMCTGGSDTVIAARSLAGLSSDPAEATVPNTWDLPNILGGQDRYFLVTLRVPAEGAWDESLMGLTGNFGVGFYASGDIAQGDSVTTDRESREVTGPLPDTGGPGLPLVLLGAGSLALGIILRRGARTVAGATP